MHKIEHWLSRNIIKTYWISFVFRTFCKMNRDVVRYALCTIYSLLCNTLHYGAYFCAHSLIEQVIHKNKKLFCRVPAQRLPPKAVEMVKIWKLKNHILVPELVNRAYRCHKVDFWRFLENVPLVLWMSKPFETNKPFIKFDVYLVPQRWRTHPSTYSQLPIRTGKGHHIPFL